MICRLMFLACNPVFIYKVFHLWKTSRVPEQCIIDLANRYPHLNPLIDFIILLENKQQPIQLTIEYIQTLKQKGYILYLFSNIGETTFEQFKKNHPTIVKLFDGFIVAERHDNWIQKPQQAAFKKLITKLHINPRDCIFIDNNKKNIVRAQHEGFTTILYQSPQQLATVLQELNVL